MVEMGVGYNDHGYLFRVHFVEKRQTISVFLVDHESAVEHDLFVVDGEDETTAAHLAACSQRQNRHVLHALIRWIIRLG